jgi:hypothetical protein
LSSKIYTKLDAITLAQEDNRSSASDELILGRANELNCPLVTTDHDFLVLARQLLDRGEFFTGLVFLTPQVSVGYAVQELETYAKAGELDDFSNRVIFL